MELFSVKDMAEISGLTTAGVGSRISKFRMKPALVRNYIGESGNPIKENLYTREQMIEMGLDKKKEKKVVEKVVDEKEKLTLEEMQKLHPLVKDVRFFKTSFFPDVRLEIK